MKVNNMDMPTAMTAITWLANEIHQRNVDAGWWTDLETGERKDRNMGEMLMLVVTEIAEAMEADRKSLKDDKLPQYDGLPVELIDNLIRVFDILGSLGVDAGEIMMAKMEYNAQRADHKPENRLKDGGKKC